MSNESSSASAPGNPNGQTNSSSLDMDVGLYNKSSIEQTLTFLGQITGAVQSHPGDLNLNGHPATVCASNNNNTSSITSARATTTTGMGVPNANILQQQPMVKATPPAAAVNLNLTIPAPGPSTNSLTVNTTNTTNTTNGNFKTAIAASDTQTTSELSPTSAALSTAAAVAAISSCFTNNTTNGNHVNAQTNQQRIQHPGDKNNLISNGINVSMNALGTASNTNTGANHATNPAPMMLPLSLTSNTFQNSNNSSSNNSSSQIHSTYQHQLQQLQLSSANTSSSNTPCPTPGPVMTLQSSSQGPSTDLNGIRTSSTSPPQGQILPQHASNTIATNILPQNQLSINNSHIITNNTSGTANQLSNAQNVRHLGAVMTNNTLYHQQPNIHTSTMENAITSKKSSNRNSSLLSSVSSTKPSTSSYNPSTMQMSMPSNVFGNMPLRRGKWTPEEERFANALIEEFEKGTILDCDNGCTLRAYLSRKLHCAPMRISKKYAGKSIGKHVFLSRIPSLLNRNGSSNGCIDGISSETNNSSLLQATQKNLQKIRDLEFHFHMSMLQEGSTCPLGPNAAKNLSSGSTGTKGISIHPVNLGIQNPSVNGGTSTVTLPLTTAPVTTVGNGSFPMIFPSPQTNGNNVASTPMANSMLSNPAPAGPQAALQWVPNGNTSVPQHSNTPATSVQMQQTLFNAFKEAQTLSSATSSTRQSTSSGHLGNNAVQGGNVSNEKSTSETPVAEGLPELYSNFQNASNTLPVVSSNNSNNIKEQQNLSNNDQKPQSSMINTSQAQQNWLSETMHIIPTLDPSSYIGQYSPTYTSQSFDDLHQFIGKEFPSSSNSTKAIATPNHAEINGPATDAANKMEQQGGQYSSITSTEADVYSILAQQSVAAMSKHSAYDSNLHVSETKSQTITNRNNPQNSNESRILDPNPLFGDPGPMQNKLAQPNGTILIPSSSQHHNIKSSVSPENAVTSSVGSGSGSVSPEIAGGGKTVEDDASSASFNAANLQLHSAAVEEWERAAAATKELGKPVNKSESVTKSSPQSSNKFVSTTVIRHANIVSGSDRSSSDNGNESMSGGGSGSSGSDNASDNSDAVSDEGQSSGSGSTGNRKRRGSKNFDDVANQPTKNDKKRQKISSSLTSKVNNEQSQ